MQEKTASLYIHIPFCVHRCAYCDFFSTTLQNDHLFSAYAHSLIKDIAFFKSLYSIDAFRTVYIGGGTPSLLPLPLMKELSHFIYSTQSLSIEEFTIEVNPQDITKERLSIWQECGINRLSVGIQSLQDDVLHNENRRGSKERSVQALELIMQEWKGLLSLDFIAGLQGQTCENLREDLEFSLQFAPHHISLYELVPLLSHASFFAEENDEDVKRREEIWGCGERFLESSGYVQYEISNFSYKGDFECVHNKAYWKMCDYVGVGAAAVGNVKILDRRSLERVCAAKAVRFSGVRDVASYIEKKARRDAYEWEEVEGIELVKDALLMGFRLLEGIDDEEFRKEFGISLFTFLPKTIAKWVDMHLFSVGASRLRLTKKGMLFLNSFLCEAFEEMEMKDLGGVV